jgi:hypothetical protein
MRRSPGPNLRIPWSSDNSAPYYLLNSYSRIKVALDTTERTVEEVYLLLRPNKNCGARAPLHTTKPKEWQISGIHLEERGGGTESAPLLLYLYPPISVTCSGKQPRVSSRELMALRCHVDSASFPPPKWVHRGLRSWVLPVSSLSTK